MPETKGYGAPIHTQFFADQIKLSRMPRAHMPEIPPDSEVRKGERTHFWVVSFRARFRRSLRQRRIRWHTSALLPSLPEGSPAPGALPLSNKGSRPPGASEQTIGHNGQPTGDRDPTTHAKPEMTVDVGGPLHPGEYSGDGHPESGDNRCHRQECQAHGASCRPELTIGQFGRGCHDLLSTFVRTGEMGSDGPGSFTRDLLDCLSDLPAGQLLNLLKSHTCTTDQNPVLVGLDPELFNRRNHDQAILLGFLNQSLRCGAEFFPIETAGEVGERLLDLAQPVANNRDLLDLAAGGR